MDTRRLILFVIFSLAAMMLWDAWQKHQHPPIPVVAQQSKDGVPTSSVATAGAPVMPAAPAENKLLNGDRIHVQTDVLVADIDTMGGDLRRLEFTQHRDTIDKQKPFVLLQSDADRTYIAQSGLIGDNLPTHKTRFTEVPGSRKLEAGQDQLEVRLQAPDSGTLKVAKIYTFHKGSYVIDVRYEVTNSGTSTVQPFAYFQFLRDGKPPVGDTKMINTYTGAAVYTEQEKFSKVDFSTIEKGKTPYPKTSDSGWIAMLQHYFVTAWIPQDSDAKHKLSREFYTKHLSDGLYTAGVIVPVGSLEPGKTAVVTVPLYAGPQEQDKLSKLAKGLDLVVDYGWLTVIASPLFWLLQYLHKLVNNWGVAIILLTILIKAAFYPLSAASYRSMAKMRLVTPKLTKLKEQYGDDRQRMHQAMMELYKTEKINPLGGCLPVVIQIPVFISLYWVLLASVELRHAPFFLWIHDLSVADPYYVLPIIMGITMVIQSRLNPTPPDPIQAKVMQIMPIAFSIFFLFFPAGLVLYWLVNNVLSIAQQWQITRAAERANAAQPKR